MSKQSNQRYRKERGLNHKERAKDSIDINSDSSIYTSPKNMPSREGYGDGNPDGSSDGISR